MEATVFTPIEFARGLERIKGQKRREYLDRLLETSSKIRAHPSEINSGHEDYLELMTLHHKHTIPAAVNIICDFNSLIETVFAQDVELSQDEKDFLIVKLRLLHFLHNICLRIMNEPETFKKYVEGYTLMYYDLLAPSTVRLFFALQELAQVKDEIFHKIAHAFSAILWLQAQINPKFQKFLTNLVPEVKVDDDEEYFCDTTRDFWSDMIFYYDKFHEKYSEYIGKLCEYGLEYYDNFLDIYFDLSEPHRRIIMLVFVEDYVEAHLIVENVQVSEEIQTSFCKFMIKAFAQEVANFKKCDPNEIFTDSLNKSQFNIVATIIKCLAMMVGKENIRNIMKDDSILLRNVVDLGLFIKKLEAEDETNFKPITKLKDSNVEEQPDVDDPRTNLKTGIVKLIANLVDNHPANQDIVRENMGLAFLLDCSPIDDRNSFIQQWSIFALNNALKNNADNQEFISSMQQQTEPKPTQESSSQS